MFGYCRHSANTVLFISHAFEKINKINIQHPTPGNIKKCISKQIKVRCCYSLTALHLG